MEGRRGAFFLGGMNNAENGMKKWDVSFSGHLLGNMNMGISYTIYLVGRLEHFLFFHIGKNHPN